MSVLTIGIVRDCFYLLIFYSEKFSIWVWRLPFAVNVNLNLSIDHRGGADPGFFVRGGVTLRNYHFNYHSYGVYHTIPVNLFPCFTSTQIRHKDFFMQNTSCIWYWKGAGEWGGGGRVGTPHTLPQDPPLDHIAPWKVIWIKACGIFRLWNPESWALESGIQLKESGIQVPLATNLESSTGIIQNPRLFWITSHRAKPRNIRNL